MSSLVHFFNKCVKTSALNLITHHHQYRTHLIHCPSTCTAEMLSVLCCCLSFLFIMWEQQDDLLLEKSNLLLLLPLQGYSASRNWDNDIILSLLIRVTTCCVFPHGSPVSIWLCLTSSSQIVPWLLIKDMQSSLCTWSLPQRCTVPNTWH